MECFLWGFKSDDEIELSSIKNGELEIIIYHSFCAKKKKK